MADTAAAPPPAEPTAPAPQGGGAGRGASTDRGDSDSGAAFSMVPVSWLASGCGAVGLALFALQQSLRLPSGFGIEDVLGWSSASTVLAALANWCQPEPTRWRAGVAYVLLDTALFMPLYGALLLVVARGLRQALHDGTAWMALRMRALLMPAAGLTVAALWLIDALENFGGAQRLGLSTFAFGASLGIAVVAFVGLWRAIRAGPATQKKLLCWCIGALAAMAALLAALVWLQDARAACAAPTRAAEFGLGWAHRAKPVAIVLALLPALFAAFVWWFGIDLELDDPAQTATSRRRAAWRSGVAGVIGRSRYVLALLALFAVFTLVLDQCRDVMLALARPAGSALGGLDLLWRVAVLIAGPLSVGLFAHSCWLWTRLAGMVRRPDVALPGDDDAVMVSIGEFARGWARALSVVPLVMVALLVAQTVGDATAAARAGAAAATSRELPWTLTYLGVFGAGVLAIAFVLVQVRMRLALANAAEYYNSTGDVYALLRGSAHEQRQLAQAAAGLGGPVFVGQPRHCIDRLMDRAKPATRAFARAALWLQPLLRPTVLPVLALLLMCVVRAGVALWPDEASQAPATLVLLGLGLTWWCGVLGLVALAEQRQTIPWGLVLLGAMGLLGLLGLVDNHVVPLAFLRELQAPAGALRALSVDGLWVTLILALLSLALWFTATHSRDPARPTAGAWGWSWRLRLVLIVVALLGALLALQAIDRRQARWFAPAQPTAVRGLEQAADAWIRQLPDAAGDPRVFLVASEGGGIRSAYWTAQVLAQLQGSEGVRDFNRRTFVLSGVSGGSMGEAVYRACLRTAPQAIGSCIAQGFGRLDALSPLIGAFVFEDVLARFLPLRFGDSGWFCAEPACGHLSRALGFEREWMRRFATLAEPLGPARDGEPELLLNSTWVESGNQAVLGSAALARRDIPASVDAVQRLGVQPTLIAAAHASARFPFINPIAGLRPLGADKADGHLADGGYHDNSATATLADAWRVLDKKLQGQAWKPQLILIRNGQTRAECIKKPRKDPPPSCLNGTDPRPGDLAEPLDKARLDLYVDVLGPAITVINVSGVGAHGRRAPGAFDQTLRERAAPCPDPNARGHVWLMDQTDEGTLVPLGWYLSPAAREALDLQAKRVVKQMLAAGCR